MANEEQLAIIMQGVSVWNEWRQQHVNEQVDLAGADLSCQNLDSIDLYGANLGSASLNSARLVRADLRWTNLRFAHLLDAKLREADLSGAHLNVADFARADLSETYFSGADLAYTCCLRARLNGAYLVDTLLWGTNFDGADLTRAHFTRARLIKTYFGNARFSLTELGSIDLSTTEGLESTTHGAPSALGIDTAYMSKGRIPEVFLRGCGVPENFIAFMRSLTDQALDFYSCFISYSMKDKHFCERLYADLQAKGVRVWLFEEDAKWGEPVWSEIDRSIKIYDKLIVVCSEDSLQSGPVNREIERALNREDEERRSVLFPVRIDRYIFDKWEHERKADVLRKVVGDFSDWDKDAAKYDSAFDKLLNGLKAESEEVR